MKVVVTPEARADLTEIWNWNATEWGVRHADSYFAFLGKHISGLSKTSAKGRPIGTRPAFRYLMKRRSSGHGHIAVYEIVENEIRVHHVYHTAQDWQAKLLNEP